MEYYKSASLQSQFRGYDYFKNDKVVSFKQIDDSIYHGKIKGNNQVYDVTIDVLHPKKNSHCNCPHAEGTKIICKHMVHYILRYFL